MAKKYSSENTLTYLVSLFKNALNDKLNKTDIVNDLTSTDSSKVLSAAQGKVLMDQINNNVGGGGNGDTTEINAALAGKQDKLTGSKGQVVGFDDDGKAVAQDAPDTGVTTFNGRKGAVTPQSGDYTAEQVGARPNTWTPTAADVGAVPATRKINNKALSADISLTAADVGATTMEQVNAAIQAAVLDSWGASY